MKYALAPIIRSRARPIPLSEDEYQRIARAKDGVIALIGIEQKFDLLLENYVEYENELLGLAVRQEVFHNLDYASFQNEALAVVRRLSNLLSAARLYIDQVKHDLSSIFGKHHEIIDAINKKCSEEYDAALGYRLMETLRNVMQHRSVSGLQLKYATSSSERGARTRVVPVLKVASLREGGIKASVHKEIAGKEMASVTEHVRQYIEGISRIHHAVRKGGEKDRQDWEAALRQAYENGANTWPSGSMRASDLIALNASGRVVESRHIILEPLVYLDSLVSKNAHPIRLSRTFVSNAAEDDDA
jgi:hypothetical protein